MKKEAVLGFMITLIVVSMLTLAFNIQQVKAIGTIYIRADGSIDPPTAPIVSVDSVTYTFTDNIYDIIVIIERDNIVVDGAGYTVQGTGVGTHSYTGMILIGSPVTIQNTNIKNFTFGVHITIWSNNNIVSGNTITNSFYGVGLASSSNNEFYHNKFALNTKHVDSDGSTNVWDNGYPSGGNYWDDYTDVDLYSGPNQDEPGSDGIWDHPYVIDENNQDDYPLMDPWIPISE